MADKIILSKAEKKLKERTTIAGAKISLGFYGWWIALFPVLMIFLILIEIVFDLNVPNNLIFALNLSLVFAVLQDVRFMRVFFGANFKTRAWFWGTFLAGPVSCAYLFVRPKHIKNDNKLKSVIHTQAEVSVIGWVGLVALMAIYFVGIWQNPVIVTHCGDSDVKSLVVEILKENNHISDVNIGEIVDHGIKDGVRVCNIVGLTYTDLYDSEKQWVSSLTYTISLIDTEDGEQIYVSFPEQQ